MCNRFFFLFFFIFFIYSVCHIIRQDEHLLKNTVPTSQRQFVEIEGSSTRRSNSHFLADLFLFSSGPGQKAEPVSFAGKHNSLSNKGTPVSLDFKLAEHFPALGAVSELTDGTERVDVPLCLRNKEPCCTVCTYTVQKKRKSTCMHFFFFFARIISAPVAPSLFI